METWLKDFPSVLCTLQTVKGFLCLMKMKNVRIFLWFIYLVWETFVCVSVCIHLTFLCYHQNTDWNKYDDRLMKAVERGEVDKVAAVLGKKGIIPTKLDVEGRSAWVHTLSHTFTHSDILKHVQTFRHVCPQSIHYTHSQTYWYKWDKVNCTHAVSHAVISPGQTGDPFAHIIFLQIDIILEEFPILFWQKLSPVLQWISFWTPVSEYFPHPVTLHIDPIASVVPHYMSIFISRNSSSVFFCLWNQCRSWEFV